MKKRLLGTLAVFLVIMRFVMAGDETICRAEGIKTLLSEQKITDSLETDDDVKCYVYTMDRIGYFTLNFTRENPVPNPGCGWEISLYDMAGNLLCEYSRVTTDFTTQKLNFKTGTKICVKISPSRSDNAPVNQIYGLQIHSVTSADWETETLKTKSDPWAGRIIDATKLTDKRCYGSLWTPSDNDVYELLVHKTGKVMFEFYPNSTNDNVGWGYDIEIYKKNGDKVTIFKQIRASTKKMFYAEKGTYYVVVNANWVDEAPSSYDDYAISAKSKAAWIPSMKTKKVLYDPKTATLKWRKVKNVDGYEIQICRNRRFRKSKTTLFTTVETSHKLPGFLRKGTYYVRVRAYADTVGGNRIYGKFTKVKKIRKNKDKGDKR